MPKLYTICLTFALLCTVAYAAKKYPMTAASIVPGARAEVAINKDKNGNTKLNMKVQHLANLENLTPRASAYVVWLRIREVPKPEPPSRCRPRVRSVTCWPLRLNGRPQDFRPVWTFSSGILLGGNKHLETLERSDSFESRL